MNIRFLSLATAVAAFAMTSVGISRSYAGQNYRTQQTATVFMAADQAPHEAQAPDAAQATEGVQDHMVATELKRRLDNQEKIIVIDARRLLNGQILKGAIHVPMDKLEEWAKSVEKDKVIVTYCTCAHDEAAIAEVGKLREWGFASAYALQGGMAAAQAAGIEVVPSNE